MNYESGIEIGVKKYNNAVENLKECASRNKILSSRPLKIYVEPTTACNLDCSYCYPIKYRQVVEMDMAMFNGIREQFFDHCSEVNLFLRGEPTLAKHFPEMLDICAKYPFITKFFSNLSYKNDAILKKMVESGVWLNVSFDGIEVTEKIRRGTNIGFVISNINLLMEYQKVCKNEKFHMRLAVVVSKQNVEKLQDIIDWAEKIGFKEIMLGCLDGIHFKNKDILTGRDVRYFDKAVEKCDQIKMRISTPSYIGGRRVKKAHNWDDFILPVDKYFPHFAEDSNPDVDNKFCPYPWIQTVFQADGEIVSCCQRKIDMGKFSPGTDFFKEVWNNQAYQDLRAMKNFRNCKDIWNKKCGIITYSIWGGENRLGRIPKPLSESI
jgi:MoaA/NifB/PqqE/SkfB family radical SAM enzyme